MKNSIILFLVWTSQICSSDYIQDIIGVDEFNPKFQQEVDGIWARLENHGTEVDISTPSLGVGVSMTGFILDRFLFLENVYLREVYAFRGIQYANASRFQIPVTKDEYPEGTVIDATKIGPACPQSRNENERECEDCQYINVYTPYLPDKVSEPLPVMVFIHGGSFTGGTGAYYFPMMYLRHDVIFATINYRLGALGFFTIDTDEAPGNYALYDQRAALRWVRDHIADFGGDNQSITVVGESAGSVSSSYMTIVADSDSIHRAISESGTFSEVWSLDPNPEYAAHYIANKVGCNNNETQEIDMDCMREADAWDLTAAEKDLVSEDRKNGLMGFRGAAPTIQSKDITDAILTEWPQWYYENGQFNDVPYMMGTNKDEGALVTDILEGDYLRCNCNEDGVCLFDNDYYLREKFVTDVLGSFGVSDPSHALTNTMILQYCEGVELGDYYQASPCLIDMFGVLFLKAGGWKVANLHAYFATSKTFHYSFDFDDHFLDSVRDENYDTGVMHAEELKYLVSPFPYLNYTASKVSWRMTTMWTNFATYGDPTPDNPNNWEELDIPKFTPYMFGDHHYMLMRADFIMQQQFPLRWTINYDEDLAGTVLTMEPPATYFPDLAADHETKKESQLKNRETLPNLNEPSSRDYSEQDVEDMEATRDAYRIAMIVFILAFIVATDIAVYYFMLWRSVSL